MDSNQAIGTGTPKAGEEYCTYPEHLFDVDTVGWDVHAREGLRGPFSNKDGAKKPVLYNPPISTGQIGIWKDRRTVN